MFFEFTTKKNEPVTINANKILFITPYKNVTMIFDDQGNEYETLEKYDSVVSRLNKLRDSKL